MIKKGNRKYHRCDGENLTTAEWGRRFEISRERMRVLIKKHGIDGAVERLGWSDERKAAEHIKATQESAQRALEKRIGVVKNGWKLVGHEDGQREIECVKCGDCWIVPAGPYPRCWTCRPKVTK
jgi:hypothetical protein